MSPTSRITDDDLARLADEDFCYVTTIGRVSGNPHKIEIWFALQGRTLYLLAGGGKRSDWVKNVIKTPAVTVRIGDLEAECEARVVTDEAEDHTAREIVTAKYQPGYGGDLTNWKATALPIAIDVP